MYETGLFLSRIRLVTRVHKSHITSRRTDATYVTLVEQIIYDYASAAMVGAVVAVRGLFWIIRTIRWMKSGFYCRLSPNLLGTMLTQRKEESDTLVAAQLQKAEGRRSKIELPQSVQSHIFREFMRQVFYPTSIGSARSKQKRSPLFLDN